MRYVAPAFTQHRLQRFHRWAMLWLAWFAALLDALEAFAPLTRPARAAAHAWLDRIEHVAVCVAILRKRRRPRALQPSKCLFRTRRYRRPTMRAMLGSRARRLLRQRDLRARIDVIVNRLDALIERRLTALPIGMSRSMRGSRAPSRALLRRRKPSAQACQNRTPPKRRAPPQRVSPRRRPWPAAPLALVIIPPHHLSCC